MNTLSQDVFLDKSKVPGDCAALMVVEDDRDGVKAVRRELVELAILTFGLCFGFIGIVFAVEEEVVVMPPFHVIYIWAIIHE